MAKKSKKSSAVILKKKSCKIEYLASSFKQNESDDDDHCTQKLQESQSRQSSITKYLKKKLSHAADSIELIKNKAVVSIPDSQIPSTQRFNAIQQKSECVQFNCLGSDDDEEICRILSESKKIVQ